MTARPRQILACQGPLAGRPLRPSVPKLRQEVSNVTSMPYNEGVS